MNQAPNQTRIKYELQLGLPVPDPTPNETFPGNRSFGCIEIAVPDIHTYLFQQIPHLTPTQMKHSQGIVHFGLASQALTPTRMKEIQETLQFGFKKNV